MSDSDHGPRISELERWRRDKERLDDERHGSTKMQFTEIKGQLAATAAHLSRQDVAQEKVFEKLDRLVDGQTEIELKLASQDGARETADKLAAEAKSDRRFWTNARIAIAAILATLFCGFLYLGWSAFH